MYSFNRIKSVSLKQNGSFPIFVDKCPYDLFQFSLQKLRPARVFLAREGGGGVLDISLGGEVRPGPHTLTLFKIKIADFLTLFKTEFRFLIPCLRHLTRNHTLCKTMINKNFAVVQFVEHTRRLFIVQEKIPSLRLDCEQSLIFLCKVTARET